MFEVFPVHAYSSRRSLRICEETLVKEFAVLLVHVAKQRLADRREIGRLRPAGKPKVFFFDLNPARCARRETSEIDRCVRWLLLLLLLEPVQSFLSSAAKLCHCSSLADGLLSLFGGVRLLFVFAQGLSHGWRGRF